MSLQDEGSPDLGLVTGAGPSPYIFDGDVFAGFAEQIVVGTTVELDAARQALLDRCGPRAVVDAAAVAALFNAINRVADAIGIQVESSKFDRTGDFRTALDLDSFQTARFEGAGG